MYVCNWQKLNLPPVRILLGQTRTPSLEYRGVNGGVGSPLYLPAGRRRDLDDGPRGVRLDLRILQHERPRVVAPIQPTRRFVQSGIYNIVVYTAMAMGQNRVKAGTWRQRCLINLPFSWHRSPGEPT